MRPTKTRLIISQTIEDAQTEGGIVLPDNSLKALPEGRVIKAGPDVTGIKEGDYVVFSGYGGTAVTIDDKPYRILEEDDVLVVLDIDDPAVEGEEATSDDSN